MIKHVLKAAFFTGPYNNDPTTIISKAHIQSTLSTNFKMDILLGDPWSQSLQFFSSFP